MTTALDTAIAINRVLGLKEYAATDEQRAFVETVTTAFYADREEREIIVCSAVAGAGKTATCLDLYNVLTSDLAGQYIQTVTFNVAAKEELISRGVEAKHAKTVNGLGHANLARYARNHGLNLDVDEGKVTKCLRETNRQLAEISPARRFAKKLIGFVKAEGLRRFDRERLEKLAVHYGIFIDLTPDECLSEYRMTLDDLEAKTFAWVADAMAANNRVPDSGDWVIDYDDQVYLPVVLNVRCFQNDLMIVDEAQDLSLANKRLIDRCLAKNGLLVLVGDDYQCIYAWRGCPVEGLSKTLSNEKLGAISTPLTLNWRSAEEIIANAQSVCPHIRCGSGRSGSVSSEDASKFDVTELTGDVAVLSRLRAPLIGMAIDCLKADVPFRFRFSLNFLTDAVKDIADDDTLSIRAFKRRLKTWAENRRKTYELNDADQAIEELDDLVTILNTILTKVTLTQKVSDLHAEIGRLDRQIREADGALTLSTIHGSKGLEWESTYVLGFDKIGSRATRDWQEVEARNLRNVANTRAKNHLIYLVESDGEE